MKDITTTPTADLIAEWKNKENVYVDEEDYRDEMGEPIENAAQLYADADAALDAHWIAIAAELDRRADELGLFIVGGCFVYAKCVNGDGPYRNWYGVVNPAEWVRITAKEQHDLEGWLLLKEGGRGA